MTLTEKIIKGHRYQIWLNQLLNRFGNNSPIGKFLRLIFYYSDGIIILRHWRDFLYVRKENIGDRYFAVDNAIMHSSYSQVSKLMHTEPQLRGNDLGIIRILAPSYLLNNPLSLGTNGDEHTGVRALFLQALPNPAERGEYLAKLIDRWLQGAASRGQIHIVKDLPKLMVEILHEIVFDISLSPSEIDASVGFIGGLALSSLPNFISETVIKSKTAPIIAHRKHLIDRYQQSPKWAAYLATGSQHQLNPHQIANSLFDMIHIAGTAGTSALMGSVVGVLCLDTNLKNQIQAEINGVWDGNHPFDGNNLDRFTLLHKTILETARLYPPVRFVSQLAQQDGVIEIGASKCPFQKGTRLLGSVFTANRDPQKYETPDIFDTNRDFSDILSWNGKEHERACPGRNLSIGIIQIFSCYLLQKYTWNSTTPVRWDFDNVGSVAPKDLVLGGFQIKNKS